jgi:hypothetical protein
MESIDKLRSVRTGNSTATSPFLSAGARNGNICVLQYSGANTVCRLMLLSTILLKHGCMMPMHVGGTGNTNRCGRQPDAVLGRAVGGLRPSREDPDSACECSVCTGNTPGGSYAGSDASASAGLGISASTRSRCSKDVEPRARPAGLNGRDRRTRRSRSELCSGRSALALGLRGAGHRTRRRRGHVGAPECAKLEHRACTRVLVDVLR